jgi:hypothetical protein
MTIGYTVQYPYAITGWVSNTLNKTGAGTTPNSITAQITTGTPATVCAAATDYIAVGTNTGGTCYKSGIVVTFTRGAPTTDCSFDGQVYKLDYNVQCADGIATADCPLQAVDSGSADFTITSDNWYGILT